MNVGMMQPTFLPWLGFFELIYKSDIFILLDDFQFSVQSYHQRNRLFVNKGQVDWYTCPVRKSISFMMTLNKTKINEDFPWREKMWKRMQQNYSKAQFFGQLSDLIENWLFTSFNSLAEQNTSLIRELCNILGLQKQFYSSSENPSSKQRSERVVELLRWSGADFYYCANGSFDYMFEEGIFPIADTEVFFQDFKTEPYDQVGSPEKFVPSLSVLDALFNVGPEATGEVIRSGTKKWITWDEMVNKRSAQGE